MVMQPTIGFPPDSLGADGDGAQDVKNRITYYPKASGTWANATAYAYQGQVGPSPLVGSGPPSNSIGSPGQGYFDLSSAGGTYIKSSQNVWAQSGQIIGAQGVPGPSGQSVPAMTSQAYTFAPIASNGTALALSGTSQQIPTAGSTQPWYFVPQAATTFAGATFVLSSANSPGSATFNLYDETAQTTRYSYTISTAGTISVQTASVGLVTGNVHSFRVSGSGNAFVQASPFFLQPGSTGINTPFAPLFQCTFATAPTSATAIFVGSQTNVAQYMGMPKSGFLYGAQLINTGGSTATVGLYTSGGTLIYSTSVSNGQTTPLTVGPFAVNQYTLAAGNYTWRVTSSATGYVSVLPQICL